MDMAYRKFNDEVFYPADKFVTIDGTDLAFLKAEAMKNLRRRMRLCAHQTVDDRIHEMFIVHTRDAYVRPHKHLNKTESFFLLEGEVEVVFFDDDGGIIRKVTLGTMDSGKLFYYRLNEPLYHTLNIKSDMVCFFEVTAGPFDRRDTVFPSWAPDGNNQEQVIQFMRRIRI
ncbi:MAG: WbuC family cupin fold metalloprotein [Candidatus Omnitrophica bacterium]|nr:WbuC family cupin fold metalloprotein [Candidatus Omnitrophota bacterium]